MTILRRIDRMLERFLGIMDGIASVSIFVSPSFANGLDAINKIFFIVIS